MAKFLHEARRSGTVGLTGEIVVVDEAAMLATADLVEVVEAADAKLVLIGDHRQLGAVEAGGLFRLLVADSRAAELHQVWRFTHPWEAAATLRLRNGDESVLGDYEAHGRIAGGSREDLLDQAFRQWRAAWTTGESIVVMAADHATVGSGRPRRITRRQAIARRCWARSAAWAWTCSSVWAMGSALAIDGSISSFAVPTVPLAMVLALGALVGVVAPSAPRQWRRRPARRSPLRRERTRRRC